MIRFIDNKGCEYKTTHSAGFDIQARESYGGPIEPGQIVVVSTGLYLDVEFNKTLTDIFELQIRSRSGMAIKGLVVANSPGTVDMDYPGEIKVILQNSTRASYQFIEAGDRIAQGVVMKVERMNGVPINAFARVAGLGSTGV
jgi:dUTP pyrophosphatase